MTDAEILFLISQAAATPHGIEVAVSDVAAFKRRFYSVRAANSPTDPELSSVSLLTCPTDPEGKVWLSHKEPKS